MKKVQQVAAVCAALSLMATSTTLAQVSADGMGKMVPVELFACHFNEGKGHADLDAAVAGWTEYMDDRRVKDYAAWTLTPYYYGPEQDFDVIWMGASTDGNTMGQGAHQWITEGGEYAAAFGEVMNCVAHVGLSSALYKAPPDGTPDNAVISMMDCEMNEGTRYSDVRTAELAWAEYQGEQGSKAGTFHWFPVFGGGDQDYDYKVVTAFPSMVELGADWEQFANGGGRAASMDIFNDIDECDDARVYIAKSRRAAQLRK
jgi:hypothetical protein